MATYSSILAWEISMDRGAWQAWCHPWQRVQLDLATEQPVTKQLQQLYRNREKRNEFSEMFHPQ